MTSSERESEVAAKNVRLKRQLAEQAEELAILQKAATYFAKPEMVIPLFLEKHQAEFSIKTMCRVLRVARSGWYVWCSGSQNQDTGITCFHFSSCKHGGKPPLLV